VAAQPAEVSDDVEDVAAVGTPGRSTDGLVERSVEIVDVQIRGREQVALRQIEEALETEGLVAGTTVLWPEDARVDRARATLTATGYFRRVTLRLEPVDGSKSRGRLVVELEERGSLEVTNLYLGSSRLTPFRGGVELVERNFLGRSVHLGGGVIWATLPRDVPRAQRQQGYRLFAEAPRIASSPVGVFGSIYLLSASEPYRVEGEGDDPDPRLFRTVDYNRIGGKLGISVPATSEWRFAAAYRFERVDALTPTDPVWVRPDGEQRDVDIDLRSGVHRLTSLDIGVSWDGREQFASLGKGGRFGLDVELSSPFLGSQYEFVKVVLGGAYGFRLPWGHWLTPSVLTGQVAGDAPRFEQFYPGDLSAWTPGREMGLIYSTRSPFDVFGMGLDQHGFATMFGSADLEYSIPLFRRPRTKVIDGGHFFFSVGTYVLAGDRVQREQRRADGLPAAPVGLNGNLGLRLDTSLGRVDLSVGNVMERLPL
jgi:outer membrane protein assembly factor BamA